MIYPKHIPDFIKPMTKHLYFDISNDHGEIYLTFDDGPHPEITPWVLDQLKIFDAKATFFLVGENALKYPSIVEKILNEGHAVANHTMHHKGGWKVKNTVYYNQVDDCDKLINSRLFRPPYGQITNAQAVHLKDRYKIVMWSDLSADFDDKVSVQDCIKYATRKVKSGSIIVFHDSETAWPRLEKALPRCLEYYQVQGFKMCSIPT